MASYPAALQSPGQAGMRASDFSNNVNNQATPNLRKSNVNAGGRGGQKSTGPAQNGVNM